MSELSLGLTLAWQIAAAERYMSFDTLNRYGEAFMCFDKVLQ